MPGPGTTTLFITHSVPEAVFLADQVVVMSARPGRVIGVVEIDEPMPRRQEFRQSAVFSKATNEVRTMLHEAGVL